MVTDPVGDVQLPTPGIVTVSPVPELSDVTHDKVIFPPAPLKTDDGLTVNELIVGVGQAFTVTVVAATFCDPQPDLAIS